MYKKYNSNNPKSHFPEFPYNLHKTILGHSHKIIHKTVHLNLYFQFLNHGIKLGGKIIFTIVQYPHYLGRLGHIVLDTGYEGFIAF